MDEGSSRVSSRYKVDIQLNREIDIGDNSKSGMCVDGRGSVVSDCL